MMIKRKMVLSSHCGVITIVGEFTSHKEAYEAMVNSYILYGGKNPGEGSAVEKNYAILNKEGAHPRTWQIVETEISLTDEELQMAHESVVRKNNREDLETFIEENSDEFDVDIDVSTLTDEQIDDIVNLREEKYARDDEYSFAFVDAIKAILEEVYE